MKKFRRKLCRFGLHSWRFGYVGSNPHEPHSRAWGFDWLCRYCRARRA